ncbi:NADPH oxidase 5-like isoform X2 [Ornithodoros turicata]|uniref:NADPH oxidase 5-like isoform X2 n=1 Tax=Ornithodoros turicata TaxID=34597 RepID=UPI0031387A9F
MFSDAVGPNEELHLAQFQAILQSRNGFFAERMFHVFDTDHSGSISLQEFIASVRRFASRSQDDKLELLFTLYDVDGDGLIQMEELRDVIRACMEENELHFSDVQVDALTRVLFEDADTDYTGSISFDEFRAQLQKRPGLYENLTISIERWMLPPKPEKRRRFESFSSRLSWPKKLTREYVRNNVVSVGFCVFYLSLHAAIFVSRMISEWLKHADITREIKEFWNEYNGIETLALAGSNLTLIVMGTSGAVEGAEVEWRPTPPDMGLHSDYELLARGFGQLLNFTCVVTILPVLRMCTTWLRSHGFSRFLPLDHHIYYHKLTGYFILFYSIAHTVAHLLNFARLSKGDMYVYSLYLFTTQHDIGWVGGTACITGWALLAILLVMVLCSLPCVRRSGRFEVFYYSHLLYVPFWFFLILHGPNFWKWFLAPGLVLVFEMLVRAGRFLSDYGQTTVMKGVVLPSKVTHLVLKRPPDFFYHPGDYVFLNIPTIAKYEWHPFTISSAPEKDGVIWLHIRSYGEWTNHLYQMFDGFRKEASKLGPSAQLRGSTLEMQRFDPRSLEHMGHCFRDMESVVLMPHGNAPRESCAFLNVTNELETLMEEGEIITHRTGDYLNVIIAKDPLVVRIDGPYGSPSSHIFQAQHAVMVAAGIGVTPFASILQSIMYRYYQARSTCPKCSHCWVAKKPQSFMKLRKVDFIWINRSQESLEWFVRLLSELEMEQAMFGDVLERFLDIHIYITSALDRTDMKAVGLQLALDLLHERDKRCFITGLKTRTQPGRPNWDQVFRDLKAEQKGKITVFYCGPPSLGQILHDHCNKNDFSFRKEIF